MARRTSGVLTTESLIERIEGMGHELRGLLEPILEEVGGVPPRPSRLIRTIGVDKSLASRLVRAVRADSDAEFMHLVPSPTGLRILRDHADGAADPRGIAEFDAAIDRFQELLDGTPGGRDSIDAHISESSREVREKREHVAKQASFKSMSFLLGHYCETLVTSLFLVPAANGRTIDAIEVHQRLGWRRMRPSKPIGLLSVFAPPEDEPPEDSTWVESLGGLGATTPMDFLMPEHSSDPLPAPNVVVEESVMTLVLAGDPSLHAPTQLTSAFRIRNGWPLEAASDHDAVRGYVLNVPCRTLVRDLFIAEGLHPGAIPHVSFQVPNPGGSTKVPAGDEEEPHFSLLDLAAPIEQLPAGRRGFEVPGVPAQRDAIEDALDRCGHAATSFRGWRCTMPYPVPLIEMIWWLKMPEARA